MLNWPYYDLIDGYLCDEDGYQLCDHQFPDASAAERYLEDEDLRGSVR